MRERHGRDGATGLLARGRSLVRSGIAASLPWLIRRSLRSGLHGVFANGPAPAVTPGTMLAANHHSWWDAYLTWLVAQRLRLPLAALMDDAQLTRFPFFVQHGAVPRSRPRELVRRLRAGGLGVVFPEGRLRSAGPPGPLAPGAVRLAELADAPLRTLAIRVALRGTQRPEAYLAFGPAVDGQAALERELRAAVAELDRRLAEADPERPAPGFERWLGGARSPDRRARGFERWWR